MVGGGPVLQFFPEELTFDQIGVNCEREFLGRERMFEIAGTPVPGTLEVEVDGTVLTEGWVHETGYFAVLFDEAALPAPGATVVIRYQSQQACS